VPITSTWKGIIFCAFAAASALGWTWSTQTIDKKISAGAIECSPEYSPAGHKLVGSFRISTSSSTNAIPSNGTGGACLVADLNRFGIPQMSAGQNRKCTKNSDCTVGLPARWSGYCDVDGERTCWVRPGPDNDDLCNKSPSIPWSEDVDHPAGKTPFDLSIPRYPEHAPLESFSSTYPGPVRWRVVACLNGIDPKTQQYYPGCKDIDVAHKEMRMEVFGPIR
jgi:hypothetical protein